MENTCVAWNMQNLMPCLVWADLRCVPTCCVRFHRWFERGGVQVLGCKSRAQAQWVAGKKIELSSWVLTWKQSKFCNFRKTIASFALKILSKCRNVQLLFKNHVYLMHLQVCIVNHYQWCRLLHKNYPRIQLVYVKSLKGNRRHKHWITITKHFSLYKLN